MAGFLLYYRKLITKTIVKEHLKTFELVILGLCIVVLAGLLFFGRQWITPGPDFNKPVLRVAAPIHEEWVQAGLSAYGPGFERELLDLFCEEQGLTLVRLRTGNWDQAWRALQNGEADMVVGPGAEPPDFLDVPVASGPPYDGLKPVLVRNNKFQPARALPGEIPYRWFWSERSPGLAKALTAFWDRMAEGNEIKNLSERYFGFLPQETDYYEIYHLRETINRKLPLYRDRILAAAEENRIDPLLLVALIYQESQFKPHARSQTGVRGLLQITQATARELGVTDRLDPGQSIQGGSRYLRMLFDRLEALDLDPWDRWFFTLAAYNKGMGHLQDAMELARKKGGDGRTWRELKSVYPLLAYRKHFSQTRHGYARGYEAVDFVESIRYYYYVLHGLVALSRPEAEQLTAFVPPVSVSEM